MIMKKIFTFIAAMLVAFAVNADPVVLPATLDVNNVSFRSDNLPNYVITEGDTAGTYLDMGAHDNSNDTLLYAEWEVTIEPITYNVAIDVYNLNSWRVQIDLLNQSDEVVKAIRYKGSSGQKGQYGIGSLDLSDLAAGNYKVRARSAYAWSKLKLKDIIFTADYSGATVNLPGTLLPPYAELSAGASIANGAIAFAPSTAPDEYATWNVSFAAAGNYKVAIDYTASNGHTYGVALLSADGATQIGAVAEAQAWDTGVKELGSITVPAAGNYKVKLTNATQWSEAVLNSITFTEIRRTLYLKVSGDWSGQKYAVYAFGDPLPFMWSDYMTLVDGETDIYTTTIPDIYPTVIFVRFDPARTAAPEWAGNWGQTANLTVVEGKDLYIIAGTVWAEYGLADGYYVIGSVNGWTGDWNITALTSSQKLEENPEAAGEFDVTMALATGNQLKVVAVSNYAITTWYPDGMDNNYVIEADHAGAAKEIYFKPDGEDHPLNHDGWHYGKIYIQPNPVQLTLVQGWNTVCLPYAAEIANVDAYEIQDINFGGGTISLTPMNGVLEPATAYLINAAAAGEHTATLMGGKVTTPVEVDGFLGNLSETPVVLYATDEDYGYFVLSGNEFHLLLGDATANVAQYKAYIRLGKLSAPSILRIVNGATNIQNVEGNETAVKFIENGKLFIKKNGVVYDAVGAVVK